MTTEGTGDGRIGKKEEGGVPEDCPGVGSEKAGEADACEGCPNQKICSSAPRGMQQEEDPAVAQITERLKDVRVKLMVLSGKGGVGKSTVACLLARALATKNDETEVGLLDLDICGPSVPKMMGVEGSSIHSSNSGWSPVYPQHNLGVMSVGFLLGSKNDAVIWRGPKKNAMICQFLRDVEWANLDYLVIDTPPGTSDEHISSVTYLAGARVDGAILVSTPQDVSCADVRREVTFCKTVKIPIIGVIENMSSFACPHCHKCSSIFPSSGGVKAMCTEMGVDYLGSIPVDPRISALCDAGKCPFSADPPLDSQALDSISLLVQKIQKAVPGRGA